MLITHLSGITPSKVKLRRHGSKGPSPKKLTRLSQIVHESTSTAGKVPGNRNLSTVPQTSNPFAIPNTTLPQNDSNKPGSQDLNTGGSLHLDTNFPQQSFSGGASMSRETSLIGGPCLSSSNQDSPPKYSPITPSDVAENEDDFRAKTGKTLTTDPYTDYHTDYSTDYSTSSGLLAHVGASLRRQVRIWEEDAGETEHWSSPAQPRSPKMVLLNSARVPPSESTKDGNPKVHGHGEDKSLKNGDAGKTQKARFDEWAWSVPNPNATEDDKETSDEQSGEEGIQETTMNNGSEPTQTALRSASSTQKTPIIP